MDILSVGLIVVGIGCVALGIGRSMAWGRGEGDELTDSPERRRALLKAEDDTRRTFGWES